MKTNNFKSWWLLGLKGLLILLVGLLVLLFPVESAAYLLTLYAVLIGLSGIFVLSYAFRSKGHQWSNWLIVEGVLDLIVATIIVLNPVRTALVLAVLFGIWLVISALFQLYRAHWLKKIGGDWRWPLANGLLTLLLSILLITYPISGIFTFSLLFGAAAFIFGVSLISRSIKWSAPYSE